MAEIKEVFDDIKDGLGEKGFMIFVGACLLFFVYNLMKDNGTSNQLTPVTAVTHYPDVETNANVVIDTLQDSIAYSEQEIIEAMEKNFEATNNYIDNGMKSVADMSEKIDGMTTSMDTISNIGAMTYYELMLLQGREGHINYNPSQALGALENAGFDTSKENATKSNGTLSNKAGSKDGNWTTFKGSNIKKSEG